MKVLVVTSAVMGCLMTVGRAVPAFKDASSPSDVFVTVIARDISQVEARKSLWSCLPQETSVPRFHVSTLEWRQRFEDLSKALVAKARALNLEADALQQSLESIREKDGHALVPVAAFRTTIGHRAVWIVHFQWELKSKVEVLKTKEGPRLDESTIHGLGRLRTYATAIDNGQVVGFETCL